jgi:hypothetical protein
MGIVEGEIISMHEDVWGVLMKGVCPCCQAAYIE